MFPLVDPTRRARSHLDDLAAEQPMLIHPAEEDPTAFIGFREEIAFAVDDHPRARTTIKVLGMNREELAEMRLDHLKPFRLLLQALPLLPSDGEDARDIRALFEEAVLPKAQYASMMRGLLTAS
jgi:hypothetical protein